MVHQVPAYGDIDHGFFGYQPKFFHRLSKANDYEVAQLTLFPQAEICPQSTAAMDCRRASRPRPSWRFCAVRTTANS